MLAYLADRVGKNDRCDLFRVKCSVEYIRNGKTFDLGRDNDIAALFAVSDNNVVGKEVVVDIVDVVAVLGFRPCVIYCVCLYIFKCSRCKA